MNERLFGYHGQYLLVDVGSQSATEHPIPREILSNFIGGAGLGTWLLCQRSPASLDPLSPAAPLAFVFSPLVGSPLTTSAKFAVMGKSPLTQRINDALCSSHFALDGKKTGYDAIVIVGRIAEPTCVVIDDGDVRFVDAMAFWGETIPASEAGLKQELGAGFRLAVIGPAGENQIPYATISHDNRHAGRGGLGAVMGAKNVKAIAVRGRKNVEFARPQDLVTYSRELSRKSFGDGTAKYRELGTIDNLLTFNRLGTLPTRNFQSGQFVAAKAFSVDQLARGYNKTRTSCAACTIGCEHIYAPKNASQGRSVRLEYENLFALGPLCGVSDPDVVMQASSFCDDYGLDTISAGVSIAFGMECVEKGLIQDDALRFGNGQVLLPTLQSIVQRNGVGEILALGTRAAAKEIGQGAEAFALHVKGLELPGYEPRALQTMALGFAVGARGADHNRSGAYEVDFSTKVDRLNAGAEAAEFAIQTENEAIIMDSLILCKFLRGVFDDRMASMAEMLSLTTGTEESLLSLHSKADKMITAKKWYNVKQGWTSEEDTLPDRFFEQPLQEGASRGAVLSREKLAALIRTYNLARGWTENGWLRGETDSEFEAIFR